MNMLIFFMTDNINVCKFRHRATLFYSHESNKVIDKCPKIYYFVKHDRMPMSQLSPDGSTKHKQVVISFLTANHTLFILWCKDTDD